MEGKTFNEAVCLDWEEQEAIYIALQDLAREEAEMTMAHESIPSLAQDYPEGMSHQIATIQKILAKLGATEWGRGLREQAAETVRRPRMVGTSRASDRDGRRPS